MSDEILVFAADRVGHDLLTYLIADDTPIARVIAAGRSEAEIVELARAHAIPVDVYDHATHGELVANGRRYEWLLNLWSAHILRQPVLDLASHRLNVHPSLVPHCRGNDGAAWAIRKDLPTGVS